ncbi:MAG: hypothetical protein Q9218_003232 [Villophora microphyllina]
MLLRAREKLRAAANTLPCLDGFDVKTVSHFRIELNNLDPIRQALEMYQAPAIIHILCEKVLVIQPTHQHSPIIRHILELCGPRAKLVVEVPHPRKPPGSYYFSNAADLALYSQSFTSKRRPLDLASGIQQSLQKQTTAPDRRRMMRRERSS